jgi:hypothetical protein
MIRKAYCFFCHKYESFNALINLDEGIDDLRIGFCHGSCYRKFMRGEDIVKFKIKPEGEKIKQEKEGKKVKQEKADNYLLSDRNSPEFKKWKRISDQELLEFCKAHRGDVVKGQG